MRFSLIFSALLPLGEGDLPPPDIESPTLVGSPVISSDGLTLTLTYSEDLDPNSVPTLTVAGTFSIVTSVDIAGDAIVATFNTAVFQSQIVTVSSSGNPIQDLAGNDAATLTDQSVTNNSSVVMTPVSIVSSTTCPAWFRTDVVSLTGSACDSWTNQADNTQNVSASGTQRPTYAASGNFLPDYPSLTCDGVDDILVNTGTLAALCSGTDKGFTIYMVGGSTSATATRVLWGVGSSTSNNPRLNLLTNVTVPGWQLTKTVDGTVDGANEHIDGLLLGAGVHVYKIVAAGSLVSFYIDQVLVGTTTLMNVGNLVVNRFSIGGRQRVAQDLFAPSEWYEWIGYNDAITEDEQLAVESYLFDRYHLSKRWSVANGSTNGAYPNGTVNTVPFRQNPLVSDSTGLQTISWYTNTGSGGLKTMALAKRPSPDSSAITLDISAQEGDGADAHNVIALGIDGSDRLHLFADMHSSAMKAWTGSGSGDINLGSFETPPIASGGSESQVTYPFGYGPDIVGDAYCLWRDGASADGNMVLYHWDNSAAEWTIRVANLISGQGVNSAYMAAPYFNRDTQRTHLVWTIREDILDFQSIHDLYYAYSDDYGVTWLRSDGSAQTVPITESNADKIVDIPENSGMVNTNVVCADASDSPVVFYIKDPGTGKTQMYCDYLVNGVWTTEQVSSWNVSWSLVGVTTPTEADFHFAFGFAVFDGESFHVIFRYRDLSQGVLCFTGYPGETWTQHTLDARNTEDGSNARYDEQLWWNSGRTRLQMYHQRVSTTSTLGAQEVGILEPALP